MRVENWTVETKTKITNHTNETRKSLKREKVQNGHESSTQKSQIGPNELFSWIRNKRAENLTSTRPLRGVGLGLDHQVSEYPILSIPTIQAGAAWWQPELQVTSHIG